VQQLEQTLQDHTEGLPQLRDAMTEISALESRLHTVTQELQAATKQLQGALAREREKEEREGMLIASLVDLDAEKRRLQAVLEAVWNDLRSERVQRALLEERLRWAAETGVVGASWGKAGRVSGDHVVVCSTAHGGFDKQQQSVPRESADFRRRRRFRGSGDAVVVCTGSINDVESAKDRSATGLMKQTSRV
jgi:hypothetical protein